MDPARFADILAPGAVLLPLGAAAPGEAIAHLSRTLGLEERSRAAFEAAALARESTGSTGIGNGVAIPHARVPGLEAPRLAVGRTVAPIDFKAADGKYVSLVFLLAVPQAAARSHLKVLAALSRLAMDKALLRELLRVPAGDGLYGLLARREL